MVIVAALVDHVRSREDDHELVDDLVGGEGIATVWFVLGEVGLGRGGVARVEYIQQPADLVGGRRVV